MSSDYSAYYVHWSDISEWNTVKKSILSDNMDNLIKGYETMLMWKLRNPNLPAYVECTVGLLEVMIQEYKTATSFEQNEIIPLITENNLRLSYSAALIRFVNHVSSVSPSKRDSLFNTAKTQNIPDWIITMRHDVSHGQTLPQLDALHIAAKLCFKWLIDNYWACEENSMGELDSEFITSSNLNDKYQIIPILKKTIALWYKLSLDNARSPKKRFIDSTETSILAFKELIGLVKSNNHAKTVAAEPLQTISRAVEEAINFQKDKEYVSKKKLIKTTDAIEALFGLMESISAKGNAKLILVNVLMESNFLTDSGNAQQWEEIILSLQHLKALSVLLELLFRKAGEGNVDAVNWLILLAPSLKSLKRKWKIYKKLEKESGSDANQKELKEKAIDLDTDSYPDVKINLAMVKPPKITLELMKGTLTNPESISSEIFNQYLKLVDPPLNQITLNAFEDLINIYCGGNEDENTDFETSDKIFTLEDLNLNQNVNDQRDDSVLNAEAEDSDVWRWRKSCTDSEIWNQCAIGLLPNQKSVDCTLPSNIKWKASSMQPKKRPAGFLLDHVVKMKKLEAIF